MSTRTTLDAQILQAQLGVLELAKEWHRRWGEASLRRAVAQKPLGWWKRALGELLALQRDHGAKEGALKWSLSHEGGKDSLAQEHALKAAVSFLRHGGRGAEEALVGVYQACRECYGERVPPELQEVLWPLKEK